MNIADNPTSVQLPGMYNKEENPRVPIIVTGNDFSTLYAPLIRDAEWRNSTGPLLGKTELVCAQGSLAVMMFPGRTLSSLSTLSTGNPLVRFTQLFYIDS